MVRTCDLTGENLPEDTPTTRIFIEDARNDVSVELDLSDAAFKGFLSGESKYALSKVLAASRPYVDPPTPTKAKTKPSGTNTEGRDAREWAHTHRPDLNVSDRGQVPNRVLKAYREHLSELAGDMEHQDNNTSDEILPE